MEIIFATGNLHKLEEAQAIVGSDIKLITPKELGFTDDIPETGTTLKANAIQKAQHLWQKFSQNCFADDTGLEIDALNGAPGVYSARYAGADRDSQKNMEKVLADMEGKEERNAAFKTVVALILNGEVYTFEGALNGTITQEAEGEKGFGYDPIFRPTGYDKNLAEISPDEKNRISHRGIAMRQLSDFLQKRQ